MGSCCSCDVSVVDKVHDVQYDECNPKDIDFTCEHGGDNVMFRSGSYNKFVSMYSQKGTKGIIQDKMTVWEDFAGEKDTIFCGVFDGHGPLGHKFAQSIRDNLPSKLSTSIKKSQQNASKHYSPNAIDKTTCDDFSSDDEDNQHLSFASWERNFLRSFNEMDQDLAKNVDTDGFCGGSTAVTLIKKGDQLIIGNLGDSRAVLCTKTNDNHLIPIQLSVDMIPDIPSEAKRVIKCGGRVFAAKHDPDVNRIWMPEGDCPGLAMTRAFGDFCLKDYGLSSIPDVSYRKLTNQDQFVVLATDGIWNVLSNIEVMTIVASAPKRSIAAKLLVKRAVQAWKQKYPGYHIDDCAAICLFLNDQQVNVRGNKRHC